VRHVEQQTKAPRSRPPAAPAERPGPAAASVAFDARYVGPEPCGIGQMAVELLRGLAELGDGPRLTVLVNDQTWLPPDLWDNDRLSFCRAPWGPRGLANQLFLPGLLRRLGAQVLHSVDCFLPLATRGVRHLVNVHDLIPLVCPDKLNRCRKVRWLFVWKAWLRLQCARAGRVVTVSRHSAADLARLLGLDERKLSVVYNPVRAWPTVEQAAELRRRLGLPGRVISAVGRQEPYKNLTALVRAFRLVADALADPLLRLVVAGSPSGLSPEIAQEARRLGLEGRVVLPGYLPEAALGGLYQVSDLFVFPSLYEGFGLPPLEAMRFGAPVVAVRRSALPEVLGDAAHYADGEGPPELAAAMLEVLRDPLLAGRLQRAGPRRAARYSRARAAARYRDLYAELLPQHAAV
jgi:glycosyltransferase involved in cell wall biosynthesis